MKPVWAFAVIGLLAACENGFAVPDFRDALGGESASAAAPTPQLSDKERLVGAIEANGCVIDINTIGPILAQASINQDQLAALTLELETEGALSPDGPEQVRLTSANCPAALTSL